jgi:tRNA 2-thiocytidine biosynthesis protein TtcA
LPRYSYTYKLLNKVLGKALHTYGMIDDGDRIAVGLSGGKDSWALLWLLAERQRRIPIDYHLFPIYIDPGFAGETADRMVAFVQQMGLPIHIEHTDDGLVAHGPTNRENPCFLCSRMRRKRLFEVADSLKCNKLALGHNKDDFIETLFINVFYAGQMSTMMPYQPFFKGKFIVIRPLIYADEQALERFAREMRWPVRENLCPSAGTSRRAEVKSLLQKLYRGNKKIKGNIFRAMRNVNAAYLLK